MEDMARLVLKDMHFGRGDYDRAARHAANAIRGYGGPTTDAQHAVVAFAEDTKPGGSQPVLDMVNAAIESLNLPKPDFVDGRTLRVERTGPRGVEVVEEFKIERPSNTIRDVVGRDKITTDQADDMSQDVIGGQRVHASPDWVDQIIDAKLAGKLAEAQREAAEDAAGTNGGGGVSIVTDSLTVGGDIVPLDKVTVNGVRTDPKAPRRRKAAK